jgi:hypothetical protein
MRSKSRCSSEAPYLTGRRMVYLHFELNVGDACWNAIARVAGTVDGRTDGLKLILILGGTADDYLVTKKIS